METSHVLDLGIGMGGEYIRRDPASVIRTGYDADQYLLAHVTRQYGIRTIRGDVLDRRRKKLFPFSNGQFQKVEIYFPYDGLLYQLATPGSKLWLEIERVLSPNGEVILVLDNPPSRVQLLTIKNKYIRLPYPTRHVQVAASSVGFGTEVTSLSRHDLSLIGTKYAQDFSNLVNSPYYNFQIDKIMAKR